ncbi:MAG: NAD-dependent epimerase/dehydratase family protein [Candidatus Bathyarchaeia archaeon]
MDSRILVTGATGFLGKRLVTKLRSMNLNVVAADLQTTEEIVSLDVRDKESVNSVLESSKPEVVVHLAAINGNNPIFDRPYDLYFNNIYGTLNICEAATRFGVRKIVFPSSTSIYGNVQHDDLPISEMTRTQPLTPYATSKVCEEMLVRDYARRTNTKVIVFRFSIIYGPEQKHANVIEQFMRKAISGDPIELLGDGSHTREFLYVDDAIDALVAGTNASSLPYDTFLISTGKPIKLKQLAEKISLMVDHVLIQSTGPGQIFSQHYDVSRAITNLNWKPRVPLDDGLSLMLEWVRGLN